MKSMHDERDGAHVTRREALRLAAAVGALGVALGARPAEAGDEAARGGLTKDSVKYDAAQYDRLTVKFYVPPADPKSAPTAVQTLDLTSEVSKATPTARSAQGAVSEGFSIKFEARKKSAPNDPPVVLHETKIEVIVPARAPVGGK